MLVPQQMNTSSPPGSSRLCSQVWPRFLLPWFKRALPTSFPSSTLLWMPTTSLCSEFTPQNFLLSLWTSPGSWPVRDHEQLILKSPIYYPRVEFLFCFGCILNHSVCMGWEILYDCISTENRFKKLKVIIYYKEPRRNLKTDLWVQEVGHWELICHRQ